jgi:hypothetical protein
MQELRKRSEALVPAFEFTNYQVNKDQKSPTNGNNGGLMMNSFNEIKVKRKKMRVLNDFDGLPGLSEPLVDQKASENLEDDISHTIREEQKKQNTIHLLSGFKRLLYTGLLLLLAICRSSLYPLMAAIPQPVIHKLVWRSILVSYRSP